MRTKCKAAPMTRRRRRLRFSIRTLALLMCLWACLCAWWRHVRHVHQERERAIASIEGLGVYVDYPEWPAWKCKLLGVTHSTEVSDLDLAWTAQAVTNEILEQVSALRDLDYLRVADDHITDDGLAHLDQLTDLQTLDLSGCSGLRGPGLTHVVNLPELTCLDLSSTSVADKGLAIVVGCQTLWRLNLDRCPFITDAGVRYLGSMTSLETLSLTHAPISDRGLRELGRLHGLRSLYLADTLVTDVGLAHLSDFSNLRALDLSNTAVTDAGLPRITVLSGLRELNLQNTQVTDRGVAALKDALPCVRVLYESEAGAMSTWRKDMDEVASGATDRLVVCSVKFGDRHAPMLEELQELVSLDLFGSNLTDAALRHVGKLTRLRKLWLGYNHIRGPGLAHLAQLQQLRFLSLNHNPLSDDALAHLKQLSCLEELELHETPITDVGLEHLEALRRLKRLTWSASGPVSITPDGVNRLRAALPHTVVDVRW